MAERGAWRACGLAGCALLLVPLAAGALLVSRALAAPDLGAPPRGPADGATEQAIAAALASRLAAELSARAHGSIVVSEQDLTVLARAHNPSPGTLHNPVARVRDGRVIVSGEDIVLGRQLTVVGHLDLAVIGVVADRHVQATLRDLDVGRLAMPDWATARLVPADAMSINVSALFGSNALLTAAAVSLDCAGVTGDGVVVGFHRASVPATETACSSGTP